jgi:hypothetical protein
MRMSASSPLGRHLYPTMTHAETVKTIGMSEQPTGRYLSRVAKAATDQIKGRGINAQALRDIVSSSGSWSFCSQYCSLPSWPIGSITAVVSLGGTYPFQLFTIFPSNRSSRTIRLPGDGTPSFGRHSGGTMDTIASIPWFLIGIAGIAWEWTTSQFQTTFPNRRGYRNLPVDEDARILRFEDEE